MLDFAFRLFYIYTGLNEQFDRTVACCIAAVAYKINKRIKCN